MPDSKHRSNLVESYFPHASHQALFSSTDKEIDEDYFKKLKPFVGHAYYLQYYERSGSPEVLHGYFW